MLGSRKQEPIQSKRQPPSLQAELESKTLQTPGWGTEGSGERSKTLSHHFLLSVNTAKFGQMQSVPVQFLLLTASGTPTVSYGMFSIFPLVSPLQQHPPPTHPPFLFPSLPPGKGGKVKPVKDDGLSRKRIIEGGNCSPAQGSDSIPRLEPAKEEYPDRPPTPSPQGILGWVQSQNLSSLEKILTF